MTDPQHVSELLPRAVTHPAPTTPQTRPQPVDNPLLAKACPNCGADSGQLCTTATGIDMPTQTHRARPRPRKAPRKRTPRAPSRTGPTMSEAELGREVAKLAKRGGYRIMHVRRGQRAGQWETATSIAGWPDLVLFGPRGILYRELKGTGGRVSPKQAEVLEQLRAAGGDAACWYPCDLYSGEIERTLLGPDRQPPPPV